MPKHKKPPKKSESEAVVEPPQETSDLVPSSPSAVEPQRQLALSRFIEAVRKAVGAALDLADAAADAMTKGVQGRR